MPSVTVSTLGSERVIHLSDPRHHNQRRSRISSGDTSSSSHAASSSSRRDSSASSADSFDIIDEDDIDPSDSASRSRQPVLRRRTTEAPRLSPVRRNSSRRIPREEAEPRRHRHSTSRHASSHHQRSESRRAPSDESVSLASNGDDYPYSHHGGAPYAPVPPPRSSYTPHPPQAAYRHIPAPSHGGYPPSMSSSGHFPHDPYAQQQALIPVGHQGGFGYPPGNPFDPSPPPRDNNPFSPMPSAASAGYFASEAMAPPMQTHRQMPPRPQSFAGPSPYGSELAPYGPPQGIPGMYPGYGGYPVPSWPLYGPPSNHGSPPPKEEKKEDKKEDKPNPAIAEIESLKALIQKHEETRLAAEKERLAQAAADAAAAAAKIAQEEAEKKKKEEIAAASKQAKEEAEKKAAEAAKKAKEEHEKKLAEAQKAKEDLEKKHKELEAEAAKLKPTPDSLKAPIRFKDAVGRKFSFPWHLCKTWKGMENLIKQAFLHVDVIGEHVHAGHYDLTGPDGEIILPQVWDTMIQPDWEISMHMWPMPEPDPPPKEDKLAADAAMYGSGGIDGYLNVGSFGLGPEPKTANKRAGRAGKMKDKAAEFFGSGAHMMPPPPPPPGPSKGPLPGMIPNDPLGVMPIDDKKPTSRPKAKSKSSKEISPFAAWVVGGNRPSKKDDEKLGLARHKSTRSSSSNSSKGADPCVVM